MAFEHIFIHFGVSLKIGFDYRYSQSYSSFFIITSGAVPKMARENPNETVLLLKVSRPVPPTPYKVKAISGRKPSVRESDSSADCHGTGKWN
jgi:hypothetical protein